MFGVTRIGIHPKSLKRFRERVRTLTARERGRSIGQIIEELNRYVRGWWLYYRIGGAKTIIEEINNWILRRLRAYMWKQWKLPRTRIRELKCRGIRHHWAVMIGNTRKGAWRLSKHGQIIHALPDKYFTAQLGLSLLG